MAGRSKATKPERIERMFGDTLHVRVYNQETKTYAWVPENSMRVYAAAGWALTDKPEDDKPVQPKAGDGRPVERETPQSRAQAKEAEGNNTDDAGTGDQEE